MTDGSVESFDIGVLRGLARLNEQQLNIVFICPALVLGTDVFRTIV